MPEKVDFDVVVIGLGPTGGTLANLLAMHGLSVCVLEREVRGGVSRGEEEKKRSAEIGSDG